MDFKIARKVSLTCFTAALVDAVVLYVVPQAYANLVIGIFVGLAILGFGALFLFFRCPYCKKRFPMRKPVGANCCPHCGQDLGTKI